MKTILRMFENTFFQRFSGAEVITSIVQKYRLLFAASPFEPDLIQPKWCTRLCSHISNPTEKSQVPID